MPNYWRRDRNGFEIRGFGDIVGGRVGDGFRDINGRWRLDRNGFERAGRGFERVGCGFGDIVCQRVGHGYMKCHGVRA